MQHLPSTTSSITERVQQVPRPGILQTFSLTLSQLGYRGHIISVGKGVILCKIPGVVLVSVSSRPQLDMQQGGLQAFDRRNTKT